jgi:hypothetical protein
MTIRRLSLRRRDGSAFWVLAAALSVAAPGCSSESDTGSVPDGSPGETGGDTSSAAGGANAAGALGSSGARNTGGARVGNGGAKSGGGTSGGGASGATSAGGGTAGAGGIKSSGGAAGSGGANTGGVTGTGGAKSSGGATGTGGNKSTGGTSGSGGAGTGGTSGSGGAGTGGTTGTGGAGTGGTGGVSSCIGTKPDATNTGVPAGTTLTVVNGNRTITQDGTTLDATDLHGFLVIKASNVKVTRSIIRGGTATQNGDGISVQSGTGILIEDTEVAIANPSAFIDGIAGSNFTVRRANIHGGVDGMKLGSNSTVECSYIHDMAYFASDPNQGGGPTHNDAIQILSGTGIHIVGNQLVSVTDQNAAIQVTQDFGAVGNLLIEQNWADGGGCTFNISHKGAATLTGVTIRNNRFGRNSFYGCPILKSTQTTATLSGNVYDNDGTPVPVQTHD